MAVNIHNAKTSPNEAAHLHIHNSQRWFSSSSKVVVVEYSGSTKVWDDTLDDDGLENHLMGENSQSNQPSLRVLFIEIQDRSRRLGISSRGMHTICNAFNVPLSFIEGISDDNYMLPLGYGYFCDGDGSGSQKTLNIFYEYAFSMNSGKGYILRQFDYKSRCLTYICIKFPEVVLPTWLNEMRRQDHTFDIGFSFTVDAALAEGSLNSFTHEISELRLRLPEYEHRQHLRSPKETTLDLHKLAQLWHITLGNLSDFHDLVTFILKSQERALKGDMNTTDRMRLELLLTKIIHLKRWISIYRDRTNIRINLSFHLSTQVDNETNLQISNFTSVIARDTQQDSSSMITIAAVTMFFLPGTFVSAIFSMVFFNVDRDGTGNEDFWVSTRWWYFIAITIPLTLCVFGVWIVWRGQRLKRHEAANSKLMAEKEKS